MLCISVERSFDTRTENFLAPRDKTRLRDGTSKHFEFLHLNLMDKMRSILCRFYGKARFTDNTNFNSWGGGVVNDDGTLV